MSMRNEMDANHVAMIARINHMISAQNDNHNLMLNFTEKCVIYPIITMVMMGQG